MRPPGSIPLRVVPLDREEANALVAAWHRHRTPVVGHRFALGVVDEEGRVRGAAIVGRPIARGTDRRLVAEVTRLVTDGTPNAPSMLYAAAARACRAMGYARVQTFILLEEPGTSLRASGWVEEGLTAHAGDGWRSRPGRADTGERKVRWVLRLSDDYRPVVLPEDAADPQLGLGV